MSNYLFIKGYLSKREELITTKSGKKVIHFTVADNFAKDTPPNWFNCEAWDKLAERIAKFPMPAQGQKCRVVVNGYTRQRINVKGDKKYTNHSVIVTDVEWFILDSNGSVVGHQEEAQEEHIEDEDIPFINF